MNSRRFTLPLLASFALLSVACTYAPRPADGALIRPQVYTSRPTKIPGTFTVAFAPSPFDAGIYVSTGSLRCAGSKFLVSPNEGVQSAMRSGAAELFEEVISDRRPGAGLVLVTVRDLRATMGGIPERTWTEVSIDVSVDVRNRYGARLLSTHGTGHAEEETGAGLCGRLADAASRATALATRDAVEHLLHEIADAPTTQPSAVTR